MPMDLPAEIRQAPVLVEVVEEVAAVLVIEPVEVESAAEPTVAVLVVSVLFG